MVGRASQLPGLGFGVWGLASRGLGWSRAYRRHPCALDCINVEGFDPGSVVGSGHSDNEGISEVGPGVAGGRQSRNDEFAVLDDEGRRLGGVDRRGAAAVYAPTVKGCGQPVVGAGALVDSP